MLYGAYVAGLILTYVTKPPVSTTSSRASEHASGTEEMKFRERELSVEESFARMIGHLQNHLFLPLFFASIGFAIVSLRVASTIFGLRAGFQPFLDLWEPTVLWRGIVYSILMCLAKLAVGLPILVYPATMVFVQSLPTWTGRVLSTIGSKCVACLTQVSQRLRRRAAAPPEAEALPSTSIPSADHSSDEKRSHPGDMIQSRRTPLGWSQITASIPPAVFMGVAMVSRGEIGLLIAQLARTGGHGEASESHTSGLLGDEAFLVAIWAILLCTLVGPISVGVVVRRWGPRVTAGIWA